MNTTNVKNKGLHEIEYRVANIQEYGEYGFNPLEVYNVKANNRSEVRDWIINHLDLSIKWQIIGYNLKPIEGV